MKALLCKAFGPASSLQLEDIPSPTPKANEVLLDVHAAGVNFPDSLIIQGKYQFKPPFPFAPGGEAAGVISAVGDKVSQYRVGQRVMALTGWGSFAEQVCVPAYNLLPMPDGMDFASAAAFGMTYGTSMHALKQRANLQPGETLLVLGAAGGVGIAAVELGKAMGARVVAGVSSADKAAFARAAGADDAVIYPRGPLDRDQQKALSAELKRVLGGDGADVVYDAVGGAYCEPALRAMNWDGRYLVVGFPAGIPAPPLNLTLLKSISIVGVFWGAAVMRDPAAHVANMTDLFRLWSEGRIRPRISRRYPLEHAGEAIRALGERSALGKIVVTVAD